MIVLLGSAALSVDVGLIYNARWDMQRSVDSGALAGASGLQISNESTFSRAIQFAEANRVVSLPMSMDRGTVEIGNWIGHTRTFVPLFSLNGGSAGVPAPLGPEGTLEYRPNAVRVVGVEPSLPLLFASVLGHQSTEVTREAIAIHDSGRCRGVWGLEGVFGSGGVMTDSYDSNLGPYGGDNRYQNGDICSNQDIRINGDTAIHGDAMWGPDFDLLTAGGSYEIFGITCENSGAVTAPPVDLGDVQFQNDNHLIPLSDAGRDAVKGGSLRLVENDNLTLPPGTFYFRSVQMVGQATLTITGPTKIYVDGDAHFGGGGIMNTTEDPKDFQVFCTGNDFTLAGGSAFYGAILAPEANLVVLGNAEYYGTVIARTIDLRGDTIIHVDESVVADLLGGYAQVSPVLVR